MAATSDVRVGRRSVYLEPADTLVLADVHAGRDATSNVELSLGEQADLTDRLSELLVEFRPDTVVFAGDVLHAFDHVPEPAVRVVDALVQSVRDVGATPILIAGNHDQLLDTVWDGPLHSEYRLEDGTVVLHGHERPTDDADRYVIGHDHPAITIEGRRRPCHLYGEGVYDDSDVVVLPSFTRLAPGVVVNKAGRGSLESPLVEDPGAFRPVVYDADAGEAHWFPALSTFRRML